MNLRDLKYLVAVAKHRHFGRAAEACFVQPADLERTIEKARGLSRRDVVRAYSQIGRDDAGGRADSPPCAPRRGAGGGDPRSCAVPSRSAGRAAAARRDPDAEPVPDAAGAAAPRRKLSDPAAHLVGGDDRLASRAAARPRPRRRADRHRGGRRRPRFDSALRRAVLDRLPATAPARRNCRHHRARPGARRSALARRRSLSRGPGAQPLRNRRVAALTGGERPPRREPRDAAPTRGCRVRHDSGAGARDPEALARRARDDRRGRSISPRRIAPSGSSTGGRFRACRRCRRSRR